MLTIFRVSAQECYEYGTDVAFSPQKHVVLLIDSTGLLKPANAVKGDFLPLEKVVLPRLLVKEYTYKFFLKFCVKNPDSKPKTFLITAGDVLHQKALKFVGKKIKGEYETHQHLTEDLRPYLYDHRYIKIDLEPNELCSILIEATDMTGKEFVLNPLIVNEKDEAVSKLSNLYSDRFAYFTNTVLYSILFYILILAIALFYFIRKRFLLFYAFYLFFMLLFHLYGFTYSPFIVTPLSYFELLRIDLRQNFYVLVTQIFYMLFLRDFMEVNSLGNRSQKKSFSIILWCFGVLLFVEIIISLGFRRYDWQFYNTIFSEICILISSIYLIFSLFRWKNLYTPPLLKAATILLFVGVIYGLISSTLGLVKTTSPILMYYPNYIFNLSVLGEVILYSIAILQQFFRTQTEQIRLQRQYALSELSLLRSQINPHFLFNTLNSIKSYIVQKDSAQATEYLTDFSDLIRSVLEKSREHIITLREELEFCEQYLKLEQKRFKNEFKYLIDRDLNINLNEWNVPAFIIQPFLENAIKHGFNGLKKKGIIRISIFLDNSYLHLIVEDNGIGRPAAKKLKAENHQSMGEKLIINRLDLVSEIYSWDIKVDIEDLKEPTGTKVKIRIPELR